MVKGEEKATTSFQKTAPEKGGKGGPERAEVGTRRKKKKERAQGFLERKKNKKKKRKAI